MTELDDARESFQTATISVGGKPAVPLYHATSGALPEMRHESYPGGVRHVSERNPKDIAGETKTPLHLIPPVFEAGVANALGHGAAKYGAWNWRQKRPAMSAYMAAMRRHLKSWYDGEDIDPESGWEHLSLAAATIAVIQDAIACGMAIDDRPHTFLQATRSGDVSQNERNGDT